MGVMEQERRLVRYLLGQLSKQECAEIEDSYLAEADSFDQLLVAEDQLIDDYVRGRLSAGDRKLFDENFLSTSERRERVRSARALMAFADKYGEAEPAQAIRWRRLGSLLGFETPVMRWALVAALMIVVVGGPLALFRINRLSSELESLRESQLAQMQKAEGLEQFIARQNESVNQTLAAERRERGRLEQELENVRDEIAQAAPPPPPLVYSFGSGSTDVPTGMSAGAPIVAIPKNKSRVQFRFNVSSREDESNLIVVTDEQGREVWRGDVRSRNNEVRLTLPVRLFATGMYRIALSDSNDASGSERYFKIYVTR